MRVIGGGTHRGALSRSLAVFLILVAIVLVAGWFAVRSDGARALIEEQVSKRLGTSVAIEKTRIGWPYVLVLENLRTPEFEAAGTAGFSAAEVRIGRDLHGWSLHLRQAIVRVMDEGDGQWVPECLARLGDLRDVHVRDIVRLTDDLRDKVSIRLTDSTLGWLNADGEELAAARDVNFRMLPVRIEKRRLHYFALDIYRTTGMAMGGSRDMHWEWLTTQELEYIELSRHDQDVYVDDERIPGSFPDTQDQDGAAVREESGNAEQG